MNTPDGRREPSESATPILASSTSAADLARSVPPDPDHPCRETALLHEFKNYLAIIAGFCDLLRHEVPETDPKHEDLVEMQKAAAAAVALLPDLAKRMR